MPRWRRAKLASSTTRSYTRWLTTQRSFVAGIIVLSVLRKPNVVLVCANKWHFQVAIVVMQPWMVSITIGLKVGVATTDAV